MPYFVMEFVDRDFDIVETEKEAKELADYYESTMREYADDKREWPTGSRIIIAKITEERGLLYRDKQDYFEMVTEKFDL